MTKSTTPVRCEKHIKEVRAHLIENVYSEIREEKTGQEDGTLHYITLHYIIL